MLTGRCSCGVVRIEVEDAFEYSQYCHCSRCRRRTGSAFSVFGGIALDKVRVSAGEDQLLLVGDPHGTHDLRCKHCFSCLYAVVREQQYAHVQLGVLDSAPSLAPQAHIWVSAKASWDPINDGLPQFAEFPP